MAVINGSNNSDLLFGTWDADTISGLDGHDSFSGEGGNDSLLGGNGDDVLYGDDYNINDNDTLRGGMGNDSLFGFHGDRLFGEEGHDHLSVDGRISFSDLAVLLSGGLGNDTLGINLLRNATALGGAGQDVLWASAVDGLMMDGGADDDQLSATIVDGVASLDGGAGNDSLHVWVYAAQATLFSGGDGDDVLTAAGVKLNLDGGNGNDTLGVGVSHELRADLSSSGQLSTGLGNDIIYVGNAKNLVITDFDVNHDKLDLTLLFTVLAERGWDYSHPFSSGWLRVRSSGADTVLEQVATQPGPGAQWLNVLTLKNVALGSLTPANVLPAISLPANTSPLLLQALDGQNSTLVGREGHDTLNGNTGNDVLDGGFGGADSMHGGDGKDLLLGYSGHDSLFGDAGTDAIFGGAGNDYLSGGDGNDGTLNNLDRPKTWNYKSEILNGGLHGGAGNDTLDGGAGNDSLRGDDGNDSLLGGEGDDSLTGGTGTDVLRGGNGNDYLTDDDLLNDNVLHASGADSLYGDAGNDVLSYGGSKAAFLYGGSDNDRLSSSGNGSTLAGGIGDDSIYVSQDGDNMAAHGGAGNDFIRADTQQHARIAGGSGNDSIVYSGDNGTVYGGDGADHLQILGDNNVVNAGAGNDLVQLHDGANGFTSYRQAVSLGTGIDTVQPAAYAIREGGTASVVTDFTTGIGGDIIDLSEILHALQLWGMPADTDPFAAGYLRLTDDGSDTVLEVRDLDGAPEQYVGVLRLQNVNNPASISSANILQGYTPVISSNAALPVVHNSKVLTLAEDSAPTSLGLSAPFDPDGGAVTIKVTRVPWTHDGVVTLEDGTVATEGMLLTGQQLTSLQLRLPPNISNNTEFIYTVTDDEGSTVNGRVQFKVTPVNDAPVLREGAFKYLDGDDVEVDLSWLLQDIDTRPEQFKTSLTLADGSPLPDWITLSDGWNVEMTAPENLQSEVRLRLTITDVDNVSTSQIISFTPGGNYFWGSPNGDTLTGHTGDDNINGGNGNDLLLGKAGNDTLYGESGSDTVKGGAGDDLITAGGLESIESDDRLYGEAGNDTLYSGWGNDWLDGGSGHDTLFGYVGSDVYIVDSVGDVVLEDVNDVGHRDRVHSSVSFAAIEAACGIEDLVLTGSANTHARGNALNNRLRGNSGHNRLAGDAGNDALDGGAGNDSLYGGSGNDRYQFGRGDGADRISENDTVSGNSDLAAFDAGISTDQLWFRRVGNDLEVSIIGSSDRLTVGGWYLGSAHRVEKFQTSDGQVLLAADVAKLVNAMASLTPPAAGQTTLPSNYQTELNAVIAANWN